MRMTSLSLGTATEGRLRTCLLRPMALARRRSTYAIEYCRSYGIPCRQIEHVHLSRRTTLGEPRPWKTTQHLTCSRPFALAISRKYATYLVGGNLQRWPQKSALCQSKTRRWCFDFCRVSVPHRYSSSWSWPRRSAYSRRWDRSRLPQYLMKWQPTIGRLCWRNCPLQRQSRCWRS